MTIFSLKFLIFVFILLIAYFGAFKKHQWQCLLVASYVFYVMVGGYMGLAFILLSTVTVFLGAKAMDGKESPQKKRILISILVFNLAILAVLKYGRFVLGETSSEVDLFSKIGLPLGISFYTFQALGYLMDVYRGKTKAEDDIFKFALFISFFPQILQGPISRFGQLHEQIIAQHDFDFERLKRGAERMLWGYFKKMVIADRVAAIVNATYDGYYSEGYVGFTVFIGVLLYGVQIYADFSGGMDIVIGLSEALDINLTENFRQPFWSKNITEFWQRWHITLGSWMRDYVFYPLALSKAFAKMGKKTREIFGIKTGKLIPTCLASFIVFTLVGIWHGTGWNYVLYGIYQGVFVATESLFADAYKKMAELVHVNTKSKAWQFFQAVRTMIIITFGWYLSRATSVSETIGMIKATFSAFNPSVIWDGTFLTMGVSGKGMIVLAIGVLLMLIADVLHEKGYAIRTKIEELALPIRWAIYIVCIFSIIIFGIYGYGVSSAGFIYQGF